MGNSFEALHQPKQTLKPEPLKEALNSEHLTEGIHPIMTCAGTQEYFKKNATGKENILNSKESILYGLHDVDYYGDPQKLKELKFKNAGSYSYVISPVDNKDKISHEYYNCTGVIVTGHDKNTDQDISFLSHQDPGYFITSDHRDNFSEDLIHRLNEIKERCIEGTIDAVIIGGNYLPEEPDYQKNYTKSIKLLSDKISQVLGFVPAIVIGPKNTPGPDNVLYENKKRRLYMARPKIGMKSTESFSPTELKKVKEGWLEGSEE